MKKRQINLSKKNQRLKQQNNVLKNRLKKEINKTKSLKYQLGEREKNRLQFFELSLDLFCIADFNGYFIDINSAWEKKLGYSQQELLSQPYLNFIHPEDVNKTLKQAEENVQGNEVINFENRYLSKNGNYIWLRWMAISIVNKKIIYAIAHDITEQKQLEANLKASQEQLLSIIESIPGGIVYADKNLCFRYVNRNYEQWIEKSKQEMLGQYIWDVLGEKAYKVVKKTIDQVLSGKNASYEGKLPIYNGKVYDVDARLVPDFNSQKEVQGYYALVYDVTEKAKTQAKIRLQWTAIESAIDGISIIQDDKFVYVNQSKLRIFGYENDEEIIGHSWLKLYTLSGKKRFIHEIIPAIAQKNFWQGEVSAQRKDGTKFIEEVSLTKVDDDVIVAVCRDISERKQAEEALRIAEETYRSIFENALEGIFQSNPEGYYLKINPAMARIYGYESPQEMINEIKHISQQTYVNSDSRQEFELLLSRQGQINNFEYQIYRRDGRIIWIQEKTRAILDNQNKILYYEGMIHDITDRKRKQAILARQIKDLSISVDENQRKQAVERIFASEEFKEIQENVSNFRING